MQAAIAACRTTSAANRIVSTEISRVQYTHWANQARGTGYIAKHGSDAWATRCWRYVGICVRISLLRARTRNANLDFETTKRAGPRDARFATYCSQAGPCQTSPRVPVL